MLTHPVWKPEQIVLLKTPAPEHSPVSLLTMTQIKHT